MPQNWRGHSSTNQSISGRDENYFKGQKTLAELEGGAK